MVRYEATGESYVYAYADMHNLSNGYTHISIDGYTHEKWLLKIATRTGNKQEEYFVLYDSYPRLNVFFDSFVKTWEQLKDTALHFVMHVSEHCNLYTFDRKTYYDICDGKLIAEYTLDEALELFERGANDGD